MSALLLVLALHEGVEPSVLLGPGRESGSVVLLECLIGPLHRVDERLHVASHRRLVAKYELGLVDEVLPRGLHQVPLLLGEVALGPLDRSLAAHVIFLIIRGLRLDLRLTF